MFLLWLRQLPWCGDLTPASIPWPAEGRSILTNTLVFSPGSFESYQVLRGSIYSFPLVRYSCPLSVGVLHALLCLKVYSWCILEERSTSTYSSAILFSLGKYSTSLRGSLVPLHFLPLEWYHLHIWDCWYFSLHSEIQE